MIDLDSPATNRMLARGLSHAATYAADLASEYLEEHPGCSGAELLEYLVRNQADKRARYEELRR